jgi:hypothetical protein
MNIQAPFGYKEIVPFNRTQKVRLLAPGELPEFARGLNAVPISYSEFAPVSREYPIVFTPMDKERTVFTAVATLGLVAGENLYNQGDSWAAGTYVPAYVRRYPFCMARVTFDKVEQKNRLICVEKSYIDDKGEALFDAKNQPGEKWQALERLLTEYEADLERTREMCGILADYALLEPFNMQAKLTKGGSPMGMTGMYRVAEAKIQHLNASQLKNLAKKGVLSRIYAHLLSLENFARLLDRKAARN